MGILGDPRPDGSKIETNPGSSASTLATTHCPNFFPLPFWRSAAGWRPRRDAGWSRQPRRPQPNSGGGQRGGGCCGPDCRGSRSPTGLGGLRAGATAVGVLVSLGIVAMTVGLVRSEAGRDLRILTATGATSRTRRTLTAATAGGLAFLGTGLGSPAPISA